MHITQCYARKNFARKDYSRNSIVSTLICIWDSHELQLIKYVLIFLNITGTLGNTLATGHQRTQPLK